MLAERELVAVLWLVSLHRLRRLLFFSGVAAGSQVSLPLCGSVLELAPAEASGHLLTKPRRSPGAACRGFFFLELQGAALFATFIGVLITFAMWVSLWENVWQAAVEPTRGAPSWVDG